MKRANEPGYAATALGCAGLIALAAALTFLTYDLLAPTLPELRLGLAIVSASLFAVGVASFGTLASDMGAANDHAAQCSSGREQASRHQMAGQCSLPGWCGY